MTPEEGGAFLALRAAGRMWERASWREYYGLEPDDWPPLRAVVRDALGDGPLTRAELGETVARDPAYAHLRDAFADPSHTFLKPFVWQGDMSFGPSRGQEPTFQRLDTNPRWTPWPDPDEAGRHAVLSYVSTYGPVSEAQVHYWLGEGLGAGRARLRRWWGELADRFAEVDVEGEQAVVLRDDVDAVAATEPSTSVRLLPAHDQWVLGPGTADAHVVPPDHRQVVSRGANLAVVGGVVRGTWAVTDDELAVTWFGDGPPTSGARGRGRPARHDPRPSAAPRDRGLRPPSGWSLAPVGSAAAHLALSATREAAFVQLFCRSGPTARVARVAHGGEVHVIWAGVVLLVYVVLMVATTAARERARTDADEAACSGDPARERAALARWQRRARGIRWARVLLTVAVCVGIAVALVREPVAYPALAAAVPAPSVGGRWA